MKQIIVSDGDSLSYKMLYSGGDSHAAGVGILLNKAMSEALVAFHPVNNRIAFAHLKNDPLPLHVVVAYAPTDVDDDTNKDEFYDGSIEFDVTL